MAKHLDGQLLAEYRTFWEDREKIKEAHRKAVEQETLPFVEELAAAFRDAQTEGYSVADITEAIGLKNKAFVYRVLREEKVNDPDRAVHPRAGVASSPVTGLDGFPLSHGPLVFDGNSVTVDIYNTNSEAIAQYTLNLSNGYIDELPEDWYAAELGSLELAFYRSLIEEINRGNL